MQKLILLPMILIFGLTPALAADEEVEVEAPTSSAYVSLGEPLVLNLSGKSRGHHKSPCSSHST